MRAPSYNGSLLDPFTSAPPWIQTNTGRPLAPSGAQTLRFRQSSLVGVMSGALLLLVMNLIGLGLGPTYVGMASDWFRADYPENSLQMALYSLVPSYFVAIGLFLWLARVLGRKRQPVPVQAGVAT